MLACSLLIGRSREGAWIEILSHVPSYPRRRVAPVRERGLKFHDGQQLRRGQIVAPVRERGLKFALPVWTVMR